MSVSCPACEELAALRFQAADFNQRLSDEVFDYYQCPACQLIFLHPIPPILGRYYHDGYYALPSSRDQLVREAEKISYRLEIVRRCMPAGQLLEIGSSYGAFAHLAKEAGYTVHALEMDARSCRFLEDVVGVRAIQSDQPARALKSLGKYDVVVLWQVIEHLPDCWSIMELVVDHLNANGVLVMATPNPKALQFQIFGRYWAHLDAPRHVQLIPASLLVQRAQELGLSKVLLTARDAESVRLNNHYGWYRSPVNILGALGLVGQPAVTVTQSAERSAVRAMTKSGVWLATRFVSDVLLAPVERTGLRGSSYTAIFRKEG